MKIALPSISPDCFRIKECIFHGEQIFLITPKEFGGIWQRDNLFLRSVVTDSNGNILSAGWPKFFNFGEKPDLYPAPEHFKDWSIAEKIDGSALYISKYQGKLLIRTRGSLNAFEKENGDEVRALLQTYPRIEHHPILDNHTLLFEWVSPSCRIVLPFEKPDLFLLGAIRHDDYQCLSTHQINTLGRELAIRTPKLFHFNSIPEILEICATIKDTEGYVLSYNKNQNRVKLKTRFYLARHALKERLNNIDNLIDLFLQLGRPSYDVLFQNIEHTVDYETAHELRGDISKLIDANKRVNDIERGMQAFIERLAGLSRKEQAAQILSAYGDTNRAGFVFQLLDGKPLENKEYKKLLYQVLKV